MKFDTSRHGRQSAKNGSVAVRQAWENREGLPAGPGEWVPWMAIWIADNVSPRLVNPDAVDRYATSYFDLPPITVQRETFALIDGLHRLEAAPKAICDYVRIVEVDVPDEFLAVRAFEANLGHGLPYTLAERIKGLKLMIRSYPQMTPQQLGRRVGIGYDTAAKYRNQFLRASGASEVMSIRADGRPIVSRAPRQASDFREVPYLGGDNNRVPVAIAARREERDERQLPALPQPETRPEDRQPAPGTNEIGHSIEVLAGFDVADYLDTLTPAMARYRAGLARAASDRLVLFADTVEASND